MTRIARRREAIARETIVLRAALGEAKLRVLEPRVLSSLLHRGHFKELRAALGADADYDAVASETVLRHLRAALRRLNSKDADELRSLLRIDAESDLTAGQALQECADNRRCNVRTYKDRDFPHLAHALARALLETHDASEPSTDDPIPSEALDVARRRSRYFDVLNASFRMRLGADGQPSLITSSRKIRPKTGGVRYFAHPQYFEEAEMDIDMRVPKGGTATGWSIFDKGSNSLTSIIELDRPTKADAIIDLETETDVTSIQSPSEPEYFIVIGTAAMHLLTLSVSVDFSAYASSLSVFCGHAPREDFPTDASDMDSVEPEQGIAYYRPPRPYLTGHAYGLWWEVAHA